MKILYGACGEGMGHAVRTAVVADHLLTRGHEILFASSGSAQAYLEKRYPGRVVEVPGFGISKREGGVSVLETVFHNTLRQAVGTVTAALPSAAVVLRFGPEAVISDFDPWSARVAHLGRLRLLAVDNIHFLTRCTHDRDLLTRDVSIARGVAAAMVPFADHYFVCPSAFARAPISEARTTLYPPILRPKILRARGEGMGFEGDHLCVYLNDPASNEQALRVLAASGLSCHVWKSGAASPARHIVHDKLIEMPFSEQDFIVDLASARAVIGSAGAQLMGEASYLGRPMLALPIGGHGEQELNAAYFQRDGYGEVSRYLTEEGLAGFLSRAQPMRDRLSALTHDCNISLLRAVEAGLRGEL